MTGWARTQVHDCRAEEVRVVIDGLCQGGLVRTQADDIYDDLEGVHEVSVGTSATSRQRTHPDRRQVHIPAH